MVSQDGASFVSFSMFPKHMLRHIQDMNFNHSGMKLSWSLELASLESVDVANGQDGTIE
jgi:hypothetical protein